MRILHCLNWDLTELKKEVPLIASQGFDTIQINPIQPLKEDHKDFWWLSYQPCGFAIGNQYGSKEDVIELCQIAHYYGIKIIADVIFTHMAEGKDLIPHDRVDKNLTNNSHIWREKKNLCGDWEYNDRYKVTHYCAGNLPGLNLYNWDLQDQVIAFLNECISCGIDGFRIDSGKSIPLPTDYFNGNLSDARPCDFLPRVFSNLDRQDLVVYFEILNTSPALIKQYFPYGLVLTDVENDMLNKDNLVTFAESHDQYYNWRPNTKSPISDDTITEWYSHKVMYYPNTLYYTRPFSEEWKSPIIKEANKCKVRR